MKGVILHRYNEFMVFLAGFYTYGGGRLNSEKFEIILVGSDEDELYSEEYQKELSEFARQANITSQRRTTHDGFSGGSWGLGEFIINHADALIGALGGVAASWIGRRSGRKLRLKVGDTELEANTQKDLEKLVEYAKELQGRQEDDAT